MRFEEALQAMREWKEVKYRNDVYYIDKKGRLRVRYSDVEMRLIPSFTAEQIMSEEWEINMLKNKKKINISEGNVKENNIFYKDCCDKFIDYVKKSHNVANNVAQRNSQDLERVADTSKTIDHFVDVSKKVSLTELWKKGELEQGWYYVKDTNNKVFLDEYVEIWDDDYSRIVFNWEDKIKQVLAPVPSWEEYLESESHCAVYSDINKWLKEENYKLKEEIKTLKEVIYDLDGLECPKCGNYHRRGWTCSQCGYGK